MHKRHTLITMLAAVSLVAWVGCGGGGGTRDGGTRDGGTRDGGSDGRGNDVRQDGRDDDGPGGDGTPTGDMTGDGAPPGDMAGDGTPPGDMTPTDGPPQFQAMCGDHVCACSDGQDNDKDGLADAADPECSGPYDDDEATFGTGIPGDNMDPFNDCFFDGDSGAGNDGCTETIPREGGGPPIGINCVNCLPLLPTGCDCYGCCTVRINVQGDTRNVRLGGDCTQANFNDEKACPSCEPVTQCQNEACDDPCEICLGVPDCRNLPPGDTTPCYTPPKSCNPVEPVPDGGTPDGGTPDGGTPDGGTPDGGTPDGGKTPECSAQIPCPAGFYCLTGQCIRPQG